MLGAAQSQSPSAWRLVEVALDEQAPTITYALRRNKLRGQSSDKMVDGYAHFSAGHLARYVDNATTARRLGVRSTVIATAHSMHEADRRD